MALKDKLMTLEDFKVVRDVDVASNSAQFTEIKADLGAQTGVISLIKDYYIKTSDTPISLTPIASTVGRMYAVVNCTAGDKFVINAYSNFEQAVTWCFIDSANNAISMAEAQVDATDLELTAPNNAAKLIINDMRGGMSYKVGNNLASKLGNSAGLSDAVKAALLTCFRNVAWISENEGQYYQQLENALYAGGSVTPTKKYYTKWSTSPPDETYGRIYVVKNCNITENKDGGFLYESYDYTRACICTRQDYSDCQIASNDVYAIELPPGTTGFTATFGNDSGSCLYVFKKNDQGDYKVVRSYIKWYASSEVVTNLDPSGEYVIAGGSKNNNDMAVTITTSRS